MQTQLSCNLVPTCIGSLTLTPILIGQLNKIFRLAHFKTQLTLLSIKRLPTNQETRPLINQCGLWIKQLSEPGTLRTTSTFGEPTSLSCTTSSTSDLALQFKTSMSSKKCRSTISLTLMESTPTCWSAILSPTRPSSILFTPIPTTASKMQRTTPDGKCSKVRTLIQLKSTKRLLSSQNWEHISNSIPNKFRNWPTPGTTSTQLNGMFCTQLARLWLSITWMNSAWCTGSGLRLRLPWTWRFHLLL